MRRTFVLLLLFLLGASAGEYIGERRIVWDCAKEYRSNLAGGDSIVCLVEERETK